MVNLSSKQSAHLKLERYFCLIAHNPAITSFFEFSLSKELQFLVHLGKTIMVQPFLKISIIGSFLVVIISNKNISKLYTFPSFDAMQLCPQSEDFLHISYIKKRKKNKEKFSIHHSNFLTIAYYQFILVENIFQVTFLLQLSFSNDQNFYFDVGNLSSSGPKMEAVPWQSSLFSFRKLKIWYHC